MPVPTLKNYLDLKRIQYRAIKHRRTFSAERTAATAGIPASGYAKTVMVKINDELVMVVLPASEKLDMHRLKEVTRARKVELAREEDFKERFPDCEAGAMPPFGNLYGVPIFLTDQLPDDQEIVFKTGIHTELAKMPYQTYIGLVSPQAVKYTTH